MATLKILLVEDNPTWERILQDKISEALQGSAQANNASIKVATRFEEAWESLNEKGPWQLLVTDIGLPIHDSQAKLGKQLVERADTLCIPTIVVSGTPGLGKQEVADFFTENNIKGFFNKEDFKGKRFIKKVRETLQMDTSEKKFNPNRK